MFGEMMQSLCLGDSHLAGFDVDLLLVGPGLFNNGELTSSPSTELFHSGLNKGSEVYNLIYRDL